MNLTGWTDEEFSVARALALQLRLMSLGQVAHGWYRGHSDSECRADTALAKLRAAGIVDRLRLEAHPFLPQVRPLMAWNRDALRANPPCWETIAEQTRGRWQLPHEPVEVYRATKRACHLFGAFVDAGRERHCEATHDLHLAQVFVAYRLRKPRLAAQWLGEAAFPKLGFQIRGMKDPDAFLVSGDGTAVRIIEFAGSYEADHLRSFHDHCAGGASHRLTELRHSAWRQTWQRIYPTEGTSYELW